MVGMLLHPPQVTGFEGVKQLWFHLAWVSFLNALVVVFGGPAGRVEYQ